MFDIIVNFIIKKLEDKHTFLKTEKANDKIHNYVFFAIIVHFNIQKLKNKHTFIQTEKAKSSHFDRTRGDKKQIFPTLKVGKLQKGIIFNIFLASRKWLNPKIGPLQTTPVPTRKEIFDKIL